MPARCEKPGWNTKFLQLFFKNIADWYTEKFFIVGESCPVQLTEISVQRE